MYTFIYVHIYVHIYIYIYISIYAYIHIQSLWRTKGSTVRMQGLDHAEAPRKAKVTRLLESTDLAWVLSARNAKIFRASP